MKQTLLKQPGRMSTVVAVSLLRTKCDGWLIGRSRRCPFSSLFVDVAFRRCWSGTCPACRQLSCTAIFPSAALDVCTRTSLFLDTIYRAALYLYQGITSNDISLQDASLRDVRRVAHDVG